MYDIDEYKTIVFIASLSSSINHIIDNLQTLPNITYTDVILKLQSFCFFNQDTAKALTTLQQQNGNPNNNPTCKYKANPIRPRKTTPLDKNKCS